MDFEERKQDILRLIEKNEIDIHDHTEKGYDFLESDEFFIMVKNKTSSQYLSLQIGINKLIIFCGGSSISFGSKDEDYNTFVLTLKQIFNNELFLISLRSNTIGIQNYFSKSEIADLFTLLRESNYSIRKLKKETITVKTIKWDFEFSKDIKL